MVILFNEDEILEDLKDVPKIMLSDCSLLLQEFVICCLRSESGMYFFEVEDFYARLESNDLTRQMWQDLEWDLIKYGDLLDGVIELHADFDEVNDSIDCVVTCYQSLPYYFV